MSHQESFTWVRTLYLGVVQLWQSIKNREGMTPILPSAWNMVLIHLQVRLILYVIPKQSRELEGPLKNTNKVYIHIDYWPTTLLLHPYLYASSHNILHVLRYQTVRSINLLNWFVHEIKQIAWHSIWHEIILKRLQSSFCVASNIMADWSHDNQMQNVVNHNKLEEKILAL